MQYKERKRLKNRMKRDLTNYFWFFYFYFFHFHPHFHFHFTLANAQRLNNNNNNMSTHLCQPKKNLSYISSKINEARIKFQCKEKKLNRRLRLERPFEVASRFVSGAKKVWGSAHRWRHTAEMPLTLQLHFSCCIGRARTLHVRLEKIERVRERVREGN